MGTNLPNAPSRAWAGQRCWQCHLLVQRFRIEVNKMKQGRTLQRMGLLSLPDELLTEVALKTCKGDNRQFMHWAKAALTCKRLCKLQLCPERTVTIRHWQSATP